MSYNLDTGDAHAGDVTVKDGLIKNLNAYARVKTITNNVVEIENVTDSAFANFTAGENVFIHVAATNGTDAELLGRFQFAKITLADGDTLTLDQNIFNVDLNFYYVQIISVPQFKNLTIENATVAPPPFDPFKFIGGVVVLQVQQSLKLQNSNIDLTEAGIPFQKKMTFRPLTEIEMYGETDGSKFAGYENFQTAERLLLNAGDGAAIIIAKNFSADSASRIGNPKTHGRANCRGAADSPFKPSNVTNIGGSSIFIAAQNLDLQPQTLAKYRSSDLPQGRGLARCYIASNTLLPADEKLYAFDILTDDSRLQSLGVQNFGSGELGDLVNFNFQLNNFAAVSQVGDLVNSNFQLNNFADVSQVVDNFFYFENKTLSGLAPLKENSLVMIHDKDTGEFFISRVLNLGADFIQLDRSAAGNLQIITIPEFQNLTLENFAQENICAVAVSDTLTLNGNLRAGSRQLNCGNSQSWNKCGGIFILARNIVFGENARLAASMIIAESLENFTDSIFAAAPNFIYN